MYSTINIIFYYIMLFFITDLLLNHMIAYLWLIFTNLQRSVTMEYIFVRTWMFFLFLFLDSWYVIVIILFLIFNLNAMLNSSSVFLKCVSFFSFSIQTINRVFAEIWYLTEWDNEIIINAYTCSKSSSKCLI